METVKIHSKKMTHHSLNIAFGKTYTTIKRLLIFIKTIIRTKTVEAKF
ncbi:hypothetical protein CoNPh26_CDS0054 [Staphylococcus phage S-CoN_Ph26]|nr:hypothetical protein CoNPh26_CDS0054 [Staphylococcus phage S-CoN_Ph26]